MALDLRSAAVKSALIGGCVEPTFSTESACCCRSTWALNVGALVSGLTPMRKRSAASRCRPHGSLSLPSPDLAGFASAPSRPLEVHADSVPATAESSAQLDALFGDNRHRRPLPRLSVYTVIVYSTPVMRRLPYEQDMNVKSTLVSPTQNAAAADHGPRPAAARAGHCQRQRGTSAFHPRPSKRRTVMFCRPVAIAANHAAASAARRAWPWA